MSNGVLNSRAAMVAVGVLAAGLVLYFVARRVKGAVGEVAKQVGTAINPISAENIVYSGVNSVGRAITGDPHFTIGGLIYDIFHPARDPNAVLPQVQAKDAPVDPAAKGSVLR